MGGWALEMVGRWVGRWVGGWVGTYSVHELASVGLRNGRDGHKTGMGNDLFELGLHLLLLLRVEEVDFVEDDDLGLFGELGVEEGELLFWRGVGGWVGGLEGETSVCVLSRQTNAFLIQPSSACNPLASPPPTHLPD